MCLLCIEIAKGTMTPKEVARAYSEVDPDDHWSDIFAEISKKYDASEIGMELHKLQLEKD